MSSSRSAIDEALSPDDLGALSEMMFPDQDPSASRQLPSGEEDATGPTGPSEDGAAETDRSPWAPPPEAPVSAPERPSPSGSPAGGPDTSGEETRPAERPAFRIYADQAATLRVLAGSRADPLGATASEIAQRALDLLGYNGRHPAAALHGHTVSEHASAPGPLIDERQWKDLLARAAERKRTSEAESDLSPDSSLGENEAQLAWVCFLVQEALYEAGFGDRRRRRKRPY